MVNRLSYKLRHFHGLIAGSMEAKQLEDDLESALLERDALKAELEAAKESHRIHAARLISEKILVSEHLEAARKQEPCGWQCRFITPTET